MASHIYLDYNATQPIMPAVRDAMIELMSQPTNASSIHQPGQAARHAVEQARRSVAGLIGARPDEILFTSGATEANATALNGASAGRIVVSAIEHPSVLEAAPRARIAPVGPDGRIDLSALDRELAEDGEGALVSVMLVNNETGVIEPVAEAARIVHRHGGRLHCDATQAPGRIIVDVDALNVDLLTLSAHKMGGPQGAGALYARTGVELTPLLRGGGQEGRRRAGTENVAAIAGFGVAAGLAAAMPDAARLTALRDRMEARLAENAPGFVVHGQRAERVGNTSCFGARGLSAETALIGLDLNGIAVSSGAACSSGSVEPSRTLLAMGVPEGAVREAIRVSLGWATEPADVDHLVESWSMVYRRALAAPSSRAQTDIREFSA
jgi:cysteine desulfurase